MIEAVSPVALVVVSGGGASASAVSSLAASCAPYCGSVHTPRGPSPAPSSTGTTPSSTRSHPSPHSAPTTAPLALSNHDVFHHPGDTLDLSSHASEFTAGLADELFFRAPLQRVGGYDVAFLEGVVGPGDTVNLVVGGGGSGGENGWFGRGVTGTAGHALALASTALVKRGGASIHDSANSGGGDGGSSVEGGGHEPTAATGQGGHRERCCGRGTGHQGRRAAAGERRLAAL